MDYSFDFEWLDSIYYVDAEVLEDGLFAGCDEEFIPVEQPVFGLTITDSTGEELEYADDILVDVATQIACNLYWFELSLDVLYTKDKTDG
jgi:hypothetical protein